MKAKKPLDARVYTIVQRLLGQECGPALVLWILWSHYRDNRSDVKFRPDHASAPSLNGDYPQLIFQRRDAEGAEVFGLGFLSILGASAVRYA